MRVWEPFRDMEALRREIDRTFNAYMPGTASPGGSLAFLPGRSARAYPLVNLSEDNDNLYLSALAPGIDADSINLTVVRNTLTISGEKSSPEGISPEQFHRSERSGGKFVRTIDLPVEVHTDGVTAEYKQGILAVTLPKAEIARPKQIQVMVN